MGTKKHQTYTHGEIIERLDEIEDHMLGLKRGLETSEIYTTGLTLFGFAFSILALTFVVVEEFRPFYLVAALLMTATSVAALGVAKRRRKGPKRRQVHL